MATIGEFQEALHYDPDTGDFIWIIKPSRNTPIGAKAGAVKATRVGRDGESKSYVYIRYKGDTRTTAQLAWAFTYGEWPAGRIYFKDKNPLNAAIDNLEISNALPAKYRVKEPGSQSEYLKNHRSEFPLAWKDSHLRGRFSIGLGEYNQMVVDQGNKCAICHRPERQLRKGMLKALAVDHCHKTGKNRQLLCTDCNKGIGIFEEDTDRLLSAISYLNKHKSALD